MDRSVKYSYFSDAFPKYAVVTTPDWLVILLAAHGGFDGLVARDRQQLSTPESLVVLSLCQTMSFVTWRRGIDDPVTEWGQLMAYMPLVVGWIDNQGPGVFYLPKPTLDKGMVSKSRSLAGELASDMSVSFPQLAGEAKRVMTEELQRRGEAQLDRWLRELGTRGRRPKGTARSVPVRPKAGP